MDDATAPMMVDTLMEMAMATETVVIVETKPWFGIGLFTQDGQIFAGYGGGTDANLTDNTEGLRTPSNA